MELCIVMLMRYGQNQWELHREFQNKNSHIIHKVNTVRKSSTAYLNEDLSIELYFLV